MSYLVSLDTSSQQYQVDWPEGFETRWMDREGDLRKEVKCLQDESLRTRKSIVCEHCMATIPEAQPVQMTDEIPMVICPACVNGVAVPKKTETILSAVPEEF